MGKALSTSRCYRLTGWYTRLFNQEGINKKSGKIHPSITKLIEKIIEFKSLQDVKLLLTNKKENI